MLWSSLAALALIAPSSATIRFPCSQLVTQRADPLVDPGVFPTPHMHQIVGGNAFNLTMDPNADPAERATCTTCQFVEDFSNYWTATMYFRAKNGSFKRVKQIPNQGFNGQAGGMTVYYMQNDVYMTNPQQYSKVTAFKKGFRMLIGNPTVNSPDKARYFRGVGYTCLVSQMTRDVVSMDFPKQACNYGIMAIIKFPTCWDGKNLDSPDHMSHMSYTASGTFETKGPCPASHPVAMPQLFYETIWDTRPFNKKADWPTDGSQPFVWSFGDGVGYGNHGDYIFGWKGDSLQRIMDEKCYLNCNSVKSQSIAQGNKCTVSPVKAEELEDQWITTLPGSPPMRFKADVDE